MTAIHYITGDATTPSTAGNRIICHICNNIGAWGKGFVLAISRRWPKPESAYRAWHRDRENNDFALGAVQFVQVERDIWVANMIGQHEITRKGVVLDDGRPPIRYDAVENGLGKVAIEASRLAASVHMPRIGCGLAGGKWEIVEPIIRRTLCDVGISVSVYDFPQR